MSRDTMGQSPKNDCEAILNLQSVELSKRILAAESLAEKMRDIADDVVALFVRELDGRFLLYERLGRFGSIIVEPLRRALADTVDEEVRVLASAALLYFGDTDGVQHLLQAVQPGNPYLCLAVQRLSASGVVDAVGHIESILRSPKLTNVDELQCLLEGLRSFGRPIPDDIRERLSSIQPEWLQKSLSEDPRSSV